MGADTSCGLKLPFYEVEVYKGMIGKYEVTLRLKLDPDNERLDLTYKRCELGPPKICEPNFPKNLFTW